MNQQAIQTKKVAIEIQFKKIEENRQKALAVVNQCVESLVRLQGAFAILTELEKESEEDTKGKPIETL